MSQVPNLAEMRAIQAVITKQRLDAANKAAAREQLLRIQLLLSQRTAKK